MKNGDLKVWKYLDIAQYLYILKFRKLHFSCVHQFEDPWEAFLSRSKADEALNDYLKIRYAVSCWHINDVESDAMWKIYAGKTHGIAIISSLSRLKSSIGKVKGLRIGEVNYDRKEGTKFSFFFEKRKSFKHEKELRMLVPLLGIKKIPVDCYDERQALFKANPSGRDLTCNVETLIQKVILSPLSPDWHLKLVRKITKEHLPGVPVRKSELLKPPY